MALDVRGKTALITGGGSGICLELTKALLDAGCNVVVADLKLTDQARKVFAVPRDARVIFKPTDVTNWEQLQNAFDEAIQSLGQLDIVVPGAGVFEPAWSSFWHLNTGADLPSTDAFKSLDINLTHPIRATQLAIDSFIRQKHGHGVVVLISSIAALLTPLPLPLYSASKAAISAFVHCMGSLEPTRNIRINAVAPGIVQTPIWIPEKRAYLDESVDEWVPVEKIVAAMMSLITDEACVGGTVLEVGVDNLRVVKGFNDELPRGRGHTLQKMGLAMADVQGVIDQNFGK